MGDNACTNTNTCTIYSNLMWKIYAIILIT